MDDEQNLIRGFISLELPEKIQRKISEVTKDLRDTPIEVKWVKPENLHITLKFLGDIKKEEFMKVGDEIEEFANNYSPLSLEFNETDYFGPPNNPKVIWLGMEGDLEELSDIASDIEEVAVDHGFKERERAFSPHLTIGRFKGQGRVGRLVVDIENKEIDPIKFEGSKIALVESNLTPEGPEYENLREIELS